MKKNKAFYGLSLRLILVVALALGLGLAVTLSMTGCASKDGANAPAANSGTNDGSGSGTSQASQGQGSDNGSKERTIMKDVRVRQAMAYALDKKSLLQSCDLTASTPIDYLIPQGLMYDGEGKDFRATAANGYNNFNLEKAQALWTQAKTDLAFETLKVKLLTFDAQLSITIAQSFKEQMEKALVGMEIEIIQLPFEDKVAASKVGEYDIEFTGWGLDYPDASSYLEVFKTDNINNTWAYSSSGFDALIDEADAATMIARPDQRLSVLRTSEKQLIETDVALIPLYQRVSAYLQKKEVSGILYHSFGPQMTFKQAKTTWLTDNQKLIRLVATDELQALDGAIAIHPETLTVLANVQEGLVRLGQNDSIEPGIAQKWEVSANGLEYTFHLRENALWSDSTAVTAGDFAFGINRFKEMAVGSNTANQGLWQAASIDKVEAIDALTLKVTLSKPVPYLLKLLSQPSFFAVPEAFATKLGKSYGTSITSVLYNGPFTIANWDVGYGYRLMKNNTYYDASKIFFHGIEFKLIKDASVAVNLYQSGEIDRVGLAGPLISEYEKNPDFKMSTQLDTTIFYFTFNMR